MQKIIFKVILLMLGITIAACSENQVEPNKEEEEKQEKVSGVFNGETLTPIETLGLNSSEEKAIADGYNQFQWSMYKSLCENKAANENVGLSPLSGAMALSLLATGADNDYGQRLAQSLGFNDINQTNESCNKIIRYFSNPERGVTIDLANSVWVDSKYQLFKSYVDLVNHNFGATIGTIDFSKPTAADIINKWCDATTHSMIPNIVDFETIKNQDILFANTLFFKGDWEYAFYDILTEKENFYGLNATTEVDMMITQVGASILENDNFKAVKLDLKNDPLSVYFILPKDVDNSALDLALNDFNTLEPLSNKSTIVKLPKFKVDSSTNLKEICLNCGIPLAGFNLSRLGLDSNERRIEQILHKTAFEVTEKGVTGAAASVILPAISPGPDEETPPTICFNRPFHYVVRDASGIILMIGKINQL